MSRWYGGWRRHSGWIWGSMSGRAPRWPVLRRASWSASSHVLFIRQHPECALSFGVLKVAPSEEVIFRNTVEALFHRALGPKLTDRCVERIRQAGIDLKHRLEGFYPRE